MSFASFDHTLFVVASRADSSSGQKTYLAEEGAIGLSYGSNNGPPYLLNTGSSGSSYQSTNQSIFLDTFYVLTYRAAAISGLQTNVFFWVNGAVGSMATATGIVAGNGIWIGNDTAAGTHFGGDIAEIILYHTLLSATDREQVEIYLGLKYDLGIIH